MSIKNKLLLPFAFCFAFSAYAASTSEQTAPTFCKINTKLDGQEICFCLHGNCKLTAPDTKSSKTGHYMLCIDSKCEVAHDSWIDCIGSTCTVSGDNATVDCLTNSQCSTTKGTTNTSLISRPYNTLSLLANESDWLYCKANDTCNYLPKSHKKIRTTVAPLPFNYMQEYVTSGDFKTWLDKQVNDYQSTHANN